MQTQLFIMFAICGALIALSIIFFKLWKEQAEENRKLKSELKAQLLSVASLIRVVGYDKNYYLAFGEDERVGLMKQKWPVWKDGSIIIYRTEPYDH